MSVKVNIGVSYNGKPIKQSFADLRALSRQAKTTSDRIQVLGAQMQLAGRTMRNVGSTMTRRVSMPLAALGGYAVKTAMDFETSFAKIQGLVGVSAAEMGELEDAASRLGPQFGKSSTEAAEALFFITSAGLRGSEAIETLEASLKASAIGLGDTAVVADLVTSATNAYGSAVLSASRATDTLTAAVRFGKLEPSDLAQSMGMVLPVASAMGVSFDQVGAAFAAMSRTGTDASTAATQLRQILATILNPTAEAREELDKYGLSAQGLRSQLREQGLLSVLQTLTGTLGTNDEAITRVFGNIRALSGVLDLMGSNAQATEEIFAGMANTTGMLDEAYGIVAETAGQQFRVAMAELGEEMRQVGLELMPLFRDIVSGVRDLTERFRELDPEQRKNIVNMAGIAAVAGPAMIVLASLTTVVQGLAAAVTFLLAHPLVATLAAIAGLIIYLNNTGPAADRAAEGFTRAEDAGRDYEEAMAAAARGYPQRLRQLEQQAEVNRLLALRERERARAIRDEHDALNAMHDAEVDRFAALAGRQREDRQRREEKRILDELAAAQAAMAASSSDASEKTAELSDEMRDLFQRLNDTYVGLGDAEDALAEYARDVLVAGRVTESTQREIEQLAQALRQKLSSALQDAEQRLSDAQGAFDEYRDSIADGIRQGNTLSDAASRQSDAIRRLAEAQQAYNDAQAAGDPEEIARTKKELEDAEAAQGSFNDFLQQNVTTAEEFAGQVNRLREAGASLAVLQQITQLGAETGGRIIAELLAGGAEAIRQANRLTAAVEAAATDAGNMAARKFFGAGVRAAQALVDGLKSEMQQLDSVLSEIIAKIEAAFAGVGGAPAPTGPTPSPTPAPTPTPPPAAPSLLTQSRRATAMSNIIGRAGFADGGFVTGAEPIFGMLGEAGPEVIIPLDRMGDFGGPTVVNVTVTSADPQAVVEAIRRYTRSNGPLGGVVSL